MEIKCDICGTINDGSTNFCKGCFQKLDAERKQNVVTTDDSVVSVIEKEEVKEVPWNNDTEIENVVPNPTPVVDNWEPVGVNGEVVKSESTEVSESVDDKEEELGKTEVLDFEELPSQVEAPVNNEVETTEQVTEENIETSIPTEEASVLEPITEQVSEQPIEESSEVIEPVIEEVTEAIGETIEEPVIEENLEVPVEEPVEQTETLEQVMEPISEEITTVEPLEDNDEIQKDVNEEIIEPISELTEEKIDEPVKVEETKDDDWSKEPVEEVEEVKQEPNYVLKYALIYVISMILVFGALIFTTKYLNKVFDNVTSDIVSFALYRLAALFTLIISTIITFKKQVPSIEKMNNVTFKILGLVAIPSILIQLFVLGFIKNTKVLMFIAGIMLSLIVLVIFFSHIRNTIKKRNETHIDDKVFFIYGIVNIVLIIGLLGFGIYARSHDLNMPKINFLYSMFNDTTEDEETVNKFVEQVQLKILEEQETIENYQFPKRIDDVEYASYEEKTPEAINLKLNDQGAIIGGTIKYRGITYTYDGEKIKVE